MKQRASATKKHSLWLMSSEGSLEELNALIVELAQRYESPSFYPHVTLLHGIQGTPAEVEAKSAQLAGRLRPLKLEFTTISHSSDFYRCVFIGVKKTNELKEAHADGVKLFGLTNAQPYRPHLSLLYCSLTLEQRLKVIAEVGCPEKHDFVASRLGIFDTEGEASSWREKTIFKLGWC